MTNNIKKVTKKDKFNAIVAILREASEAGISLEGNEQITYDTLINFVTNEMILLDKKAEGAQKRAAERKAEGDLLRDKIYEVLSDTDFMFINDIVAAVAEDSEWISSMNDPEITANKITARLKQLKELGKVEQDSISTAPSEGGKKKRLSAYRRLA